MDLTAKLPDEILLEVFDRLPSLCSKLRLESVNHRFQRCLVQLLNTKPIPLDIDVTGTKLNGYDVPRGELSGVVQTLANKVKFNSIDLLSLHYSATEMNEFNLILAALVSSCNGSLGKVTKFQIVSRIPVSETLLTEVFAKCTKLTDVRVDLPDENMKNFGLALKDKSLTQLSFALGNHTREHLIQLYQSIKPHMLKKIKLFLFDMTLDVDMLVTELYGGAWAALEEMELHCRARGNMQMDKLFSTIPNLTALRKCNFLLRQNPTVDQLVAALTSLFTNQIEISVLLDRIFDYKYILYLYGCLIVSVIRRVRAVHPDLRVDFVGDRGDRLRLSQGKVSFRLADPERLWRPNCLDCGIFYPALLSMLSSRADGRVRGAQQDVHLANARLDRCRIDTVVAHLNTRGGPKLWQALQAEMNEAQNLATITFESQSMAMGQFKITVDCGHCLTNGCFGCIMG